MLLRRVSRNPLRSPTGGPMRRGAPLLLLALVASSRAEAGLSATYRAFETGPDPRSVCVADFDADGRPDLAVANYENPGSDPDQDYPGSVFVLLGNGDGTFRGGTPLGVAFNAVAVAAADLDANGRADLVAANWGSNSVSVLLGNGDGTFAARTDLATGLRPNCVIIADLNADLAPDLVTANYNGNSVSVLLGNGDGTFGASTEFPAGLIPYSVAAADLNADGRPDLAVV